MEIMLKLEQGEVEYLGALALERPAKESMPLILKLRQQATTQTASYEERVGAFLAADPTRLAAFLKAEEEARKPKPADLPTPESVDAKVVAAATKDPASVSPIRDLAPAPKAEAKK